MVVDEGRRARPTLVLSCGNVDNDVDQRDKNLGSNQHDNWEG